MEIWPLARELLLVGGGHSHVIFLRKLAMKPLPGLRVTLVSPDTRTPYSGMLPGLIAGHYTEDEAHIDLVPLCRFAGVDFVRARAVSLDTTQRQLHLEDRPTLHYDILSLDTGSTPSLAGLSDARELIPVKPIADFLQHWKTFLIERQAGSIREAGVVGGGAGGVELCLAMQHRLKHLPGPEVQFHLFTSGKRILEGYNRGTRKRLERLLAARGVEVHSGFHVKSVVNREVISESGEMVSCDRAFGVTQAEAHAWFATSGLAVDEKGFVAVGDTLQSTSHENVFAVGDCAAMVRHPRPRAGVHAVRQGPPLFRNIRACALGKKLEKFRPQSSFLSLLSTGGRHAVASRNGFTASGAWVWQWKNRIDQGFMSRFNDLPAMPLQEPVNELQAEFDEQMYCGGCGSKVAADLLTKALSDLMAVVPKDDAAVLEVPAGKVLLQSVDHFRSFLNDPWLQARICVCHALSDIYACGGEPLSLLASVTLPYGKPDMAYSLLTQVMRGVLDQLAEEGAELIGGHTSEGLELALGCTANGLVEPDRHWGKEISQAGQALVLTKPLGTGTLFAADMRHSARGEWIASALEMMLTSNKAAAVIGKAFDVHACTDITGFGLAGHLLEMTGRNFGVELNMNAMPLLEGAAECLDADIRSSLHEANRRVAGLADVQPEILFDPQTAGGLLFALPEAQAEQLVQRLRDAGYPYAALIGRTTAGKTTADKTTGDPKFIIAR